MARLTAGTARMASASALRQVLSTGLLAVTAAVVARCLGPRNFGEYAGGTAAFNLTGSLTDLGFSLVLVREMTHRPDDRGRLMGAGIQSQLVWSLVLTGSLLIGGITAGGTRGAVMLALCPAVALSGLGVARQIFGVRFQATPLLVLDVSTNVLQCLVMIALALAHAPVVLLALNMSFFSCATGALALVLARKVIRIRLAARPEVLRFLRMALPIGFASVLASLYFTIDQTLLGWLVSPPALGRYAVAVRLLTVVVMVPGFVMVAAVPGLAQTAADRIQLSRFASTVSHWIAVTALPLGAGVAIFAQPVILLLFGRSYLGAVPIVRILMLAAGLSFVSNVLGITLMTLSIVRPQILFNSLGLIVNVVGNIVLVPRYGILASAWLTVLCEGIAVSYSVVALRKRLAYRAIVAQLWRPIAAVGIGAAWGELLVGDGILAILSAGAVFLGAMTALRAWPELLSQIVRGRLGRWFVPGDAS
ncbi:MAG: oligosaccharide flippase family protein [Trebonia sp.]